MGAASSKQTEQPTTPASRHDRQKCWEARDTYFACLDGVGVVKAGEEGKACTAENQQYAENCAKSWIEYFNQRRIIADAQKDRLAQAGIQAQNAKKSGR